MRQDDHHEFSEVPDVRYFPNETCSYIRIDMDTEQIETLRNSSQESPIRDMPVGVVTAVHLRKRRQVIQTLKWQPIGYVWTNYDGERFYSNYEDIEFKEITDVIDSFILGLEPPTHYQQRIGGDIACGISRLHVIAAAAIVEHQLIGWEQYNPSTGKGITHTPAPAPAQRLRQIWHQLRLGED